MKRSLKILALGLIVLALFAGCAKQPAEEIEKAKAAVSAAVAEGAEKYAPEEAKMVNDSLNVALDEIKAQDAKFFKNYGKAKEMLAKVTADADALKGTLAQKKEEAKQKAMTAIDEAKAAVDEAKKMLAKAPKGKGSKADIEAMKADVKGLEDGMMEVEQLMGTEDYLQAAEKAMAIKDKAMAVSEQVKGAMAKKAGK